MCKRGILVLVLAFIVGCGPTTQDFHIKGAFPLDITVVNQRIWLLTQTYDQDAEKSYGLALYSLDLSGTALPTRFAQTEIPELAGATPAMFSASLTQFTEKNPGIVRGFGYFYKTGYQTTSWIPGQVATQIETKGFKTEVAWNYNNPLISIDEGNDLLWFKQAFGDPAQLPLINFRTGTLEAKKIIAPSQSKAELVATLGNFDFYADCRATSRFLITDKFILGQSLKVGDRIPLGAALKSLFSKPGRYFCGNRHGSTDDLWIAPNGEVYAVSVTSNNAHLITTIGTIPQSDFATTSMIANQLPGDRWLIAAPIIHKTYRTEPCSSGIFARCAPEFDVHSFRLQILEIASDGTTVRKLEIN